MKLDPKIVEAAEVRPPIPNIPATDWPEHRARRVILALAEAMPEDAIGEAGKALVLAGYNPATAYAVAEIAIAAFLKHVAGDSP